MAGEANIWSPRTLLELSADTKRVEQRLTATAGQTLFTLTDFAYAPGTGALAIFRNGLALTKGTDWAESATGTTFSLVAPSTVGDQILAVGYVAITADVDVRGTDIYIDTYQDLRDYVGTETTVYARAKTTLGDGGRGFFQLFTGAASGTYVDDNSSIIVPTGGNGSSAWVNELAATDSAVSIAGYEARDISAVTSTYTPDGDRLLSGNLTVGDEILTGASRRDAYVVGRTITGATDCHGFADRTVIESVSDAGTYGAFDVTAEYSAAGTLNHLYAFQGRGQYSGAGQLDNYASFYHQPTFDGAVIDMHAVRVYDAGGTGEITNHHGLHIRPLTRGTNNFAIFSWGSTPSIHVGQMTYGTSALNTGSGVSVENITSMDGIKQSGINSNCGGNSAALTDYAGYRSQANLVAEGAPYSVPVIAGYIAENAALGVDATADAQYGFYAKDQTQGTANAAFRGGVSAGATKWNIYCTGSAQNYVNGNFGFGLFQPTAKIDIAASNGAAGNAPLKLNAGVNLVTPENGTLEFDGTNLYFTVGGVRKTVTLT